MRYSTVAQITIHAASPVHRDGGLGSIGNGSNVGGGCVIGKDFIRGSDECEGRRGGRIFDFRF
jgi:hypothetical protein